MEDGANYAWRFGFNNIIRLLLTEWLRSLRYTMSHSRFTIHDSYHFHFCSFPLLFSGHCEASGSYISDGLGGNPQTRQPHKLEQTPPLMCTYCSPLSALLIQPQFCPSFFTRHEYEDGIFAVTPAYGSHISHLQVSRPAQQTLAWADFSTLPTYVCAILSP